MSEAKVSAAKAAHSARPGHPPEDHGGPLKRKKRCGMRAIPVSRDAQRLAAAILEVLAGVRTPTEAAGTVGLTLPRYYFWEQRALAALARACEPRPKGKAASERRQMAVLEKEVARLRQDCTRQQALVRASQRVIGLAPSSQPAAKPGLKPTAKPGGKAKRKRRPVVRALKAVAALQVTSDEKETLPDSSSTNGAEVLQRSAFDSLLPAAAAAGAVAAGHEA